MYYVVRHDMDNDGFSWVDDDYSYEEDYWNCGDHLMILSSHETSDAAHEASEIYNKENRKTEHCR